MRYLIFSFLAFISFIGFAQEPGNNLGKNVYELKASFPDLIQWGGQGDIINYKSPEANVLFGTKNNIVVTEYTSFEGDNNYLQMLYSSLIKSFAEYTRRYSINSSGDVCSFTFSYFNVHIVYFPYQYVSLRYELHKRYYP